VLFPSVVADIDDLSRQGLTWSIAIPAGMAAMLVVVSLIGSQIVLQIRRRPEKGLIVLPYKSQMHTTHPTNPTPGDHSQGLAGHGMASSASGSSGSDVDFSERTNHSILVINVNSQSVNTT